MSTYYFLCFILALFLTALFVYKWNHRYEIYFTLIFIIVPITNLGYWQLSVSTQLEQAILANKIVYLGACFVPLSVMLSIFTLCRIQLKRQLHTAFFLITVAIYSCSLTVGYSSLFYKSVSLVTSESGSRLVKEYSFLHVLFYVMILSYLLLGFVALLHALKYKKDVSIKNIVLLLAANFMTIIAFVIGRLIGGVEVTAFCFDMALLLFLIVADRMILYDVKETVMATLLAHGDMGVASFDLKHNFLGCNDIAKEYFPPLAKLRVDGKIDSSDEEMKELLNWLETLEEKSSLEHEYKIEDRYYNVTAQFLYDRTVIRGYHFVFQNISERKQQEERLRTMAVTDEMTKLYNRRAFEEDVRMLQEKGFQEKMVVVSLDLNGLKRANDSMGHVAGDELIKGAAECMISALRHTGKIYRTGGDEFVGILFCDEITLDKLLDRLDRNTDGWSGNHVRELAISKGAVGWHEFPDYSIAELEKEADRRMYIDKAKFYERMGYDRRRR